MASSPPLELKVSPLQQIFSLVMIIGALILFLGPFLWTMWHAPRGFDATSLVLGGAIAWLIYGGARQMWLESGLYLRADEENIIVGTRNGRQTLRWDEIYAFTTDEKSTRGAIGDWLSLRGRDDQVLAQWDRNGCRLFGGQVERSNEIEDFVNQKLRALGRLKDEETAATRLWKNLHPMWSGGALEVRTIYGWIGWMNVVFCISGAFLAWNARTREPIAISIFLLFAALGVYLIAANATLRVNEETIEATSAFGRKRMEWSEVARVQLHEQGNSLFFQG